jgi:solute carrier family 39 (zinc transporter), member 1/2/3
MLVIGVTTVMAPDGLFRTLGIVIVFHQMFEGIALGTRLAEAGSGPLAGDKDAALLTQPSFSTAKKLLMAAAFALITPIGMAIGIGVLQHFNGNDRQTLLATGTLDALSAGILAWVGLVEMLSHDWMHGGELSKAGPGQTAVAFVALVTGLVLMSLLGKWT